MTSNQANNDARIAIFYEHPEWFKPMFAELNRRGIAYYYDVNAMSNFVADAPL